MKSNLAYIFLFLGITFSVLGQAPILNVEQNKKILFENLSFEEALQKSKKEHKLIFIDTHASWCKPCKEMDKFTFTDSTLSSYFNFNFINIKIDMETEEGEKLGKEYQISVVPTLLFLDKEGNLLSKYVGGLAAYELLSYAKALKEGKVFSSEAEINQFIHKGARQKYFENPCDVDLVITYIGTLSEEEQQKEMAVIKNKFVECLLEKNEYSKQQTEFLLERLVQNRNEDVYKFYQTNREKFKKNYGDSLMAYENYMEEALFFNALDSFSKNRKKEIILLENDIKQFETIISTYRSFSEKLETQSKERDFERSISHSFVIFIINREAMKFYFQNKESRMFAKYLLEYGKMKNFEKYISEVFRNDSKMPMYFLSDNTLKYLQMEIQDEEVLSHLSIIWKQVLEKKYLASFSDYFTAAKIFFHNKEKQKAQTMLEKAFELKNESFDEEKYNELKTQINKL